MIGVDKIGDTRRANFEERPTKEIVPTLSMGNRFQLGHRTTTFDPSFDQ